MEMHDSALAQVRRANRSVSRLYNLVLSSCGLAATQYVLLQSIGRKREVSQQQLAQHLSIDSTTLSRRLSALRKRGLVDLHLGARGSRIYSLTSAGRALLTSTSLQWESAQHRLRSALGDKDWQVFIEICDRICQAAKQAETMRVALCRTQAAG